ncbi:hypothetical protein PQC39_gp142 [Vibrio phage Vp_R1]|uniref:Uncharacterized protein n=1 Tax=Vibrio phage Vp_R1 TaxID=2059867 RepID=A0A2H5BQS2_9CAUD|nr:hypothetical protein PQC39_gp142 [Vibrio phage Vp_R1]AUG88506.1 hypothetical protein VPR_142 [Vibrio phage Vp_R1]
MTDQQELDFETNNQDGFVATGEIRFSNRNRRAVISTSGDVGQDENVTTFEVRMRPTSDLSVPLKIVADSFSMDTRTNMYVFVKDGEDVSWVSAYEVLIVSKL